MIPSVLRKETASFSFYGEYPIGDLYFFAFDFEPGPVGLVSFFGVIAAIYMRCCWPAENALAADQQRLPLIP